MRNFCETAQGYFTDMDVDPTAIALPAGFTPLAQGLPTSDKPVLAIRRSGYGSCKLEVLTARYMIDYRPRSPWRSLGNDSVHDDGEPILGWKQADELLQFA